MRLNNETGKENRNCAAYQFFNIDKLCIDIIRKKILNLKLE